MATDQASRELNGMHKGMMMDQLAEVRAALLSLRDALNRCGEDIDIRVDKITITMLQDRHAKYAYNVSAKQISHIDL